MLGKKKSENCFQISIIVVLDKFEFTKYPQMIGHVWYDVYEISQDVFALAPSAEIRALREESPSNLATLCYKAVEKIVAAADASCRSHKDHVQVLNSIRLLTRLVPYMFEDPEWRDFFWTQPAANGGWFTLFLIHKKD